MSNIISIKELENTKNKYMKIEFSDYIEGLDLVEPLTATLEVNSLGDFIEIHGNVKGIVKLVCDFCLKDFEYKLDFDVDETYAKNALSDSYGEEIELKNGQFVTDLFGSDEIDICDLLYQSVILSFPNKKVCGINCKGREFLEEQEIIDPRLEVFKNIQINPKNS